MHQTLDRFVTPAAAKTLSEVYNKISQAYVRRPGDEALKDHLEGVKKTLAETRRSTGIDFLCFRVTKTKSSVGANAKGSSSAKREKDDDPGARSKGKEK